MISRLFLALVVFSYFSASLFSSDLGEGVVWRYRLHGATIGGVSLPLNLEEEHLKLAAYEFDAFKKLKSIQEDPTKGFNLFCTSVSVIFFDREKGFRPKSVLFSSVLEAESFSDASESPSLPASLSSSPVISISGVHDFEEYESMRKKGVHLVGFESLPETLLRQAEDRIKDFATLCDSLDKTLDKATSGILTVLNPLERFVEVREKLATELETLKESSTVKQEEREAERARFFGFIKARYSPDATFLKVQNVKEGIRRSFAAKLNEGDIFHSEQYKIFHRNLLGDLNLVNFVRRFAISPDDGFICGIIVHNHTTNDMCCRCAPALAIDYSCEEGTGESLYRLIAEHNESLPMSDGSMTGIETFVNFFVSSRYEYQGYDAKTETPSRRYVNNEDDDTIDLLDLWRRRLVVQWAIPSGKIKPLSMPIVSEDGDGAALEAAASIFGEDDDW